MIRAAYILVAGLSVCGCQADQTPAESSSTSASESSNATATANQSELSATVLYIEGMVCQGCAEAVTGCLTGIEGVARAEVSLDEGSAHVRYDASKTSPGDMIAALQAVDRGEAPSFQVTVSDLGE